MHFLDVNSEEDALIVPYADENRVSAQDILPGWMNTGAFGLRGVFQSKLIPFLITKTTESL